MGRWRRAGVGNAALVVAALAALVAVRWAATGGLDRPIAPPEPTLAAPSPTPSALTLGPAGTLLYLGGHEPLIARLGTHDVVRLGLDDPGIIGLRPRVLGRGSGAVLSVSGTAYVAPVGQTIRLRALGQARSLLAAPHPDRVWLVSDDIGSSSRHYLLREVALPAGRTLSERTLPYDLAPVAVTARGLLVHPLDGALELLPAGGGRRVRLGDGSTTFIDVAGALVAYVAGGKLHLRNLATGRDRLVPPPGGSPSWLALGGPMPGAVCCGQFGAFSPDGRTLAMFTRVGARDAPGVALVDVAGGAARLLPGSEGALPVGCWPCLGWRSAGDWLFFFASGPLAVNIGAYQLGAARAELLDLDVGRFTSMLPTGLAAS